MGSAVPRENTLWLRPQGVPRVNVRDEPAAAGREAKRPVSPANFRLRQITIGEASHCTQLPRALAICVWNIRKKRAPPDTGRRG